MTQSRNHELIEQGRMANAVKAAAMTLIEDMMRIKIELIITTYRNYQQGDPPYGRLLGLVAELTALSDLVRELESMEDRGSRAMEREISSAP